MLWKGTVAILQIGGRINLKTVPQFCAIYLSCLQLLWRRLLLLFNGMFVFFCIHLLALKQ